MKEKKKQTSPFIYHRYYQSSLQNNTNKTNGLATMPGAVKQTSIKHRSTKNRASHILKYKRFWCFMVLFTKEAAASAKVIIKLPH